MFAGDYENLELLGSSVEARSLCSFASLAQVRHGAVGNPAKVLWNQFKLWLSLHYIRGLVGVDPASSILVVEAGSAAQGWAR